MSHRFFIRTSKTLVRMSGCAGQSESSMCAHANLYLMRDTASLMKDKTKDFVHPANGYCALKYAELEAN